jgi:hypothetical protein
MRQFKRYGLATGLATLLVLGLVGCGGSGTGNQTPRVSYSSVVSFGDSLSDPGAYKVGDIADAEFARLFFGIWLSPRTSAPALRQALMGNPP